MRLNSNPATLSCFNNIFQNTDDLQDELSSFRQQWQEELQQQSRSNSPQIQQETNNENASVQQQNKNVKSDDPDESTESRVGITEYTRVSK